MIAEAMMVVQLLLLIPLAYGLLVIKPQDTEVLLGNSTYLNCSTSIITEDMHWYHYAVGATALEKREVYAFGKIYIPYLGRFTIDEPFNGTFNLLINSVQEEDAGRYDCQDDGGFGDITSAQLVVLVTYPVCRTTTTMDEVVGPNSCQLEPDKPELSCIVQFRGNIPPIMDWTTLKENASDIQQNVTQENNENNVTYHLMLKVDLSINGSTYICQTTRSTSAQLACSLDPINILYAFDSNFTANARTDEELICSANSSQSCSYRWKWFQDDDVTTESKSASLKPTKTGWHKCEADCSIKKQPCTILAMYALVYQPQHTSTEQPLYQTQIVYQTPTEQPLLPNSDSDKVNTILLAALLPLSILCVSISIGIGFWVRKRNKQSNIAKQPKSDIHLPKILTKEIKMPPTLNILKEPKCLVENGPDGKITINAQVLEELKSLDKEVVVVAIAGPYRTGKSYLMNKLAGQNKGFALGSTVQPKTKGIWIWVREHPKHNDRYLVLLDTEGLGDVEKGDENHDNQILCLSVLLASTFVYNVMGVIGNDAIMKLHYITELSKHIQVRSSGKSGEGATSGDDSNFDFYFPDFVYAIRDFGLDLEIDGREVTADEYMEHSLTMKPGERPEVKTFNQIKECIRKYFRKRKCFTFIAPVAGKCLLLDEVPDENLLPEFRTETEQFVNYIFQESHVKKIGGKKLQGRMLGSLLEVCVEKMRTGIPYVENAVDTMAKLENSHAKQQAVELYESLMLQSLTIPVREDAEFSHCHSNCRQKAIDLFLSKAVFDVNHLFQKQMNEDIEKKYRELVDMNEGICRQRCQEALEQLYEPIKRKLMNGHYTRSGGFRLYKDDVKQLEEIYKTQQGRLAIKMKHVLLEFLYSKKTDEEAILRSDEMVTVAERKWEEERQKAIEMERQKQEAERNAAREKQRREDQLRALETKMQEEAEYYKKQTVQQRLAEQQRLMSEGFQRESHQMKLRIDDLNRQIEKWTSRGDNPPCVIL